MRRTGLQWGVVLLVTGAAACSREPELVPEPQQFALGCPERGPAWPPLPTAPLVVLGDVADLRLAGDTVGWALPTEDVEVEEEEVSWWAELLDSLLRSMLGLEPEPMPLIAVPGAVRVTRWDVAEELRRAGYRVLDAATADSVPGELPELGGDLRRLEAFYAPNDREDGDSLAAWIGLELLLWREGPVPRWRRRFEAELIVRQDWQPERADLEGLVGRAWCDLLAQVGEAFREREFSEAVGAPGTPTGLR